MAIAPKQSQPQFSAITIPHSSVREGLNIHRMLVSHRLTLFRRICVTYVAPDSWPKCHKQASENALGLLRHHPCAILISRQLVVPFVEDREPLRFR